MPIMMVEDKDVEGLRRGIEFVLRIYLIGILRICMWLLIVSREIRR